MSSLLNQIRSWAARELPYWERATLEKLATEKEPEEPDFVKLVEYFLQDAGLEEIKNERAQYSPSEEVQCGHVQKPCRLVRLFNLRNVNALPEGQEIPFGPQLTIVYGNNAAGKTGYSRPLASVGFARGERHVLPNLTRGDLEFAPQADIEVLDDGNSRVLRWTEAGLLHELSRFYVFDGNSVLEHLTAQNSLSFSPSGLSILTRLAELTDQVRERVKKLINVRDNPPAAYEWFDGDSAVRKELERLDSNTDLAVLTALGELSEAEKNKIGVLQREIAQLTLIDASKEIERKGQEKQSLERLIEWTKGARTGLGEQTETDVKKLVNDLTACRVELERTGAHQFQSDRFSQVGTELWREFLTAARHLAEVEQRADRPYPTHGDQCLFCRQNLSHDALELIGRYWQFLRSDAQTRLEKAEEACSDRIRLLERLNLGFFSKDSKVRSFLSEELPEVVLGLDAQAEAFEARREDLIESLRSGHFRTPSPLINSDLADLGKIIETLRADIQNLEQSNAAQRSALAKRELRELEHREKLGQKLTVISSFVEDKKWAAKARQSLGSTRAITNKYSALYKELVTDKYIALFSETLRRFNEEIHIAIETKGSKGETVRQIILCPSQFVSTRPVDQVLSDGEKRAVAISDFLTEVTLDEANCGIILDDPVTSLDQNWKDTIAQCLVEHASKRQVIIFTHDLAFVYALKKHAEETEIDLAPCWIRREESGPGFVYRNEGPVCERDYKTTRIAREYYSKAKSLPPSDQQAALQHGFGALRTTYEAFIVFDLFQGVVERFEERIKFMSLKDVKISAELIGEVTERMEAISRFIDAHLHSDAYASVKPTPMDLLNEIERFESVKNKQKLLRKGELGNSG